jgi:hypothetical protein
MLFSFSIIRGFKDSRVHACLPAGRGSSIDFPEFHLVTRVLDPTNPTASTCVSRSYFLKRSIHDLNSLINISPPNR